MRAHAVLKSVAADLTASFLHDMSVTQTCISKERGLVDASTACLLTFHVVLCNDGA